MASFPQWRSGTHQALSSSRLSFGNPLTIQTLGSIRGAITMPKAKAVVLVVEDDAIIRMGALDLIQRAGFVAIEAVNADEAIKILQAGSDVHLVFTDVEMPGTMDGFKLSHYIRHR